MGSKCEVREAYHEGIFWFKPTLQSASVVSPVAWGRGRRAQNKVRSLPLPQNEKPTLCSATKNHRRRPKWVISAVSSASPTLPLWPQLQT